MGLTADSTGLHAAAFELEIKKTRPDDAVIALAGNPNVGKSTVFNALTGLRQHTGNWPGKTVGNAQGTYTYKNKNYVLVDIPGAYSLSPHSAEEEIARDFICFGGADATIVVCDATCLLRNLNLVLQTLEITDKAILCVNLMDEAGRRHIQIDCKALAAELGVPVVATSARDGAGLTALTEQIRRLTTQNVNPTPRQVAYRPEIEKAIAALVPVIQSATEKINPRWLALRLLDPDEALLGSLNHFLGFPLLEQEGIAEALGRVRAQLEENGLDAVSLRDAIVSDVYKTAEAVCAKAVRCEDTAYNERQLAIDRLLTNKVTGIPVMILLLLLVLWITISGANYPSALLSKLLFGLQDTLTAGFAALSAP
ncbi:MAG: FeoB small GTPase domain-containing protein, partial [Clostridia bacterium]